MLSVCELSASCNPLIGLWGCRLGEDSPRSMPLGAADVFNPSAGAPESPLAPTAYTAEEPFYLEQLFHLDSALTNEGAAHIRVHVLPRVPVYRCHRHRLRRRCSSQAASSCIITQACDQSDAS